jgi:mannan endo-1,4-beta-mannosidase
MLKNSAIILITLLLFSYNLAAQSPFVKVKGHQFMVKGKPYYYIGFNYWYGGLLALQQDPKRGKERLCKELDFLKAKGINNLRVLAGSEGIGLINGVDRVKPSLQPAHGKYNAKILGGLDYLLYEMGKRKMYAVLFLSNNWEWSGGFLQYLNWNHVITDSTMQSKMNWDDLRDNTTKFYSCGPCQADYQKQVTYILKHVNKYTGRAYTNEPAIMAWELANEPRPMRPAAIEAYYKWTADAALFIKKLDKNHLVTLGTEGAMGTESEDVFRQAHAPKQVDYLTLHIWPKNWGWFKDTSITQSLPQVIGNAASYINKHQTIANGLNKPLVIEEFGLPRDRQSYELAASTSSRNKFYDSIFALWQNSKVIHGSIAGCNIWAYGGMSAPKPGQIFWKDGDDFMGDPPQEEQGLNSVFNADTSTWNVITKYTKPIK